MTEQPVSTLEMRILDRVLAMEGGYVLDFSDRTFAEFFREHGVAIDLPRYSTEGGSKAKRLRYFLRTARPPLGGQVLAGLLAHRLASKAEIDPDDLRECEAVVRRLGGDPPSMPRPRASARPDLTEDALLTLAFQADSVRQASKDPAMTDLVIARMEEAQRCLTVNAYLSAVILAGSVLEALCLGFGTQYPERVNRAYLDCYKKDAVRLHEWSLKNWIEVLGRTGDLSPNIEKFAHGLRDFRNYVHPAAQLASGFTPDRHTARIGLQVVVAAIDDLGRAYGRLEGRRS